MSKPEKLFGKELDKVEETLLSVLDEVKEIYGDEDYEKVEYVTCAKNMLLAIIMFLQKMDQEQWKTSNVLKHIFMLLTGPSSYLFLARNYSKEELYVLNRYENSKREVGDSKVYLFAARWIFYYYRMFEMGKKQDETYDECNNILITIEMKTGYTEDRPIKVKKKKKERELSSNEEEILKLKCYLDDYIVEQDNLKKNVAVKMIDYILTGRRTVMLVIGPTGSGKTYLIDVLEKYKLFAEYDVQFFRINASLITQEGFKGQDITDVMSDIGRRMTLESKKRAVIVLDEVDKIMMPSYESNGENVNANIQASLMNFISGNEKSMKITDTREYMFILQGAFTRLDELEREERNERGIGFSVEDKKGKPIFDESLRDKLIKIGGIEELVGRITTIVRISKLSKSALKEILLNKRYGKLKEKQNIFAEKSKSIILEENAVDYLVDYIYEEDLGARSVRNVMDSIASDERLFDMIEGAYDVMRITKEVITEGEEPVLEKFTDEVAMRGEKNGKIA